MKQYKFRAKHNKIQWYVKAPDEKEKMVTSTNINSSLDNSIREANTKTNQKIEDEAIAAFTSWYSKRELKRKRQNEALDLERKKFLARLRADHFIETAEALCNKDPHGMTEGQKIDHIVAAKSVLEHLGHEEKMSRKQHLIKFLFG
jgi:hypothetical protein